MSANNYKHDDYICTELYDCRGIKHICEIEYVHFVYNNVAIMRKKLDDIIISEDKWSTTARPSNREMHSMLDKIIDKINSDIKWRSEVMYGGALTPWGGWL